MLQKDLNPKQFVAKMNLNIEDVIMNPIIMQDKNNIVKLKEMMSLTN